MTPVNPASWRKVSGQREKFFIPMTKQPKDFGSVKNTLTGKTLREMTWEEILSLPAERLTREEAQRRMNEVRVELKAKK